MSRMYSTSLLSAPHDVRVTSRPGGGLVRGNRNSTFLGRELTPGLLAPVSNLAGRSTPAYVPRRSAVSEPRRGKVCPGCGVEASLSGRCDQCW